MPKVIPEYKEEAQKRLLEVATRYVLEKKYLKVSMEEIAREAGVSRPTLYLYYKNKEELLLAIVSNLIEEIWNALEHSQGLDLLNPDGSFFDQVQVQFGDRFIIFFEIITSAKGESQLFDAINTIHEKILKRIAEVIETKYPEKLSPGSDPYIAANAILSLFIGLNIRIKLGYPLKQAKQSWQMVISGLFQNS